MNQNYISPDLIIFLLSMSFLLLVFLIIVLSIVSAILKGETFSFSKIPRLILFGFKVWMGIALDDQEKKKKMDQKDPNQN